MTLQRKFESVMPVVSVPAPKCASVISARWRRVKSGFERWSVRSFVARLGDWDMDIAVAVVDVRASSWVCTHWGMVSRCIN